MATDHHRPPHHQLALRGAGGATGSYDRETRTFDSWTTAAGPRATSWRRRAIPSLRRPGHVRRDSAGQPDPPAGRGWREAGYPGRHRHHQAAAGALARPEEFEARRFFFCQLEAIETLIWLAEAPAAERVGHRYPGRRRRLHAPVRKMATGSGKTIVMAMVIAWQILNKVANPQDARFSKNVLVIAPGLTVKSRLEVLEPAGPGNYYDAFNIVPVGLARQAAAGQGADPQLARARTGRAKSRSRSGAAWTSAAPRATRPMSATCWARWPARHNLLVINDEAHHAWRVTGEARRPVRACSRAKDSARKPPSGSAGSTASTSPRHPHLLRLLGDAVHALGQEEQRGGAVRLDRQRLRPERRHRVRAGEDAARGGARRRVPDAKTYKSRLYHIYNDPDVKDDLNRKARAAGAAARPRAQRLLPARLGLAEAWKAWKTAGLPTPPVMITVGNRTETAARSSTPSITKRIHIDELCDPERVAAHRLQSAGQGRGAGGAGCAAAKRRKTSDEDG